MIQSTDTVALPVPPSTGHEKLMGPSEAIRRRSGVARCFPLPPISPGAFPGAGFPTDRIADTVARRGGGCWLLAIVRATLHDGAVRRLAAPQSESHIWLACT